MRPFAQENTICRMKYNASIGSDATLASILFLSYFMARHLNMSLSVRPSFVWLNITAAALSGKHFFPPPPLLPSFPPSRFFPSFLLDGIGLGEGERRRGRGRGKAGREGASNISCSPPLPSLFLSCLPWSVPCPRRLGRHGRRVERKQARPARHRGEGEWEGVLPPEWQKRVLLACTMS